MRDLLGHALGRYTIDSLLAVGGMATVYRAHQTGTDHVVAVKVLRGADPEWIARFRAEAKAVQQLEHPHILPVYGSGEEAGLLYLIMPLITGGTLTERGRQPVALGWVIQVCQQVATALDYAHSCGVIHRDVKPSNILLDGSDCALLTDFGVAQSAQRVKALTEVGISIGTAEYMSPEQALGQPVSGRSDQYGLAITCFELLAGRLPYQAETPFATARLQCDAPIPSLVANNFDIPPGVDDALRRALAKNPAERFPSAVAFTDALAHAAASFQAAHPTSVVGASPSSGSTASSAARPEPSRVRMSVRRRPWRPAPQWFMGQNSRAPGLRLAAPAALALLIVGLVGARGFPSTPDQPDAATLRRSGDEGSLAAAASSMVGPLIDVPSALELKCLEHVVALAELDNVLATNGLATVRTGREALLGCSEATAPPLANPSAGMDVFVEAMGVSNDGEPSRAMMGELRDLPTTDSALSGFAGEGFTALHETRQAALDAAMASAALDLCHEVRVTPPNDAGPAPCIVDATSPRTFPTPTLASSQRSPTLTATRLVTATQEAQSQAPLIATIAEAATPTPATVPSNCIVPTAAFSAPVVRIGQATTLLVTGFAPGSIATLRLAMAPSGYAADPLQLVVGAGCRATFTLTFGADDHPPGTWTYLVQGTRPNDEVVELTARLIVAR